MQQRGSRLPAPPRCAPGSGHRHSQGGLPVDVNVDDVAGTYQTLVAGIQPPRRGRARPPPTGHGARPGWAGGGPGTPSGRTRPGCKAAAAAPGVADRGGRVRHVRHHPAQHRTHRGHRRAFPAQPVTQVGVHQAVTEQRHRIQPVGTGHPGGCRHPGAVAGHIAAVGGQPARSRGPVGGERPPRRIADARPHRLRHHQRPVGRDRGRHLVGHIRQRCEPCRRGGAAACRAARRNSAIPDVPCTLFSVAVRVEARRTFPDADLLPEG